MKTLSGLRLSWPASCEICARWPARPVCAACLERHGHTTLRCPGCALPMAPGLPRCLRCREAGPGRLHRCLARVDYAHPWSGLVARLKREPAWARQLAQLLADTPGLPELLDEVDLIAPVPLSHDRLRERGYNQAWELVRHLRRLLPGSALAVPDLLLRHENAGVQHELERAQRFANMERAYTVAPARRSRPPRDHVLLVDDVMTTGATLEAAAAVLLEAGAARVSALVFARTPAPETD